MIGKKILKDMSKALLKILISLVILVVGLLIMSTLNPDGNEFGIVHILLLISTGYMVYQFIYGFFIKPYLTYINQNVGKSEFQINNPNSVFRNEDGEKTTYNTKTTELNSIMFGATFIQKENSIEVLDIHPNGSFYNANFPKGGIITKMNGKSITTEELFQVEPKFSDTYTFTFYKNGNEESKQVFIVNGGSIRSLINRIGKKAYDRLNDCSNNNIPIAFDTNFLINNYEIYGLPHGKHYFSHVRFLTN